MFYGGGPHQGQYPRQYAPRGPTSVDILHGHTWNFSPQFGPVPCNRLPGPPVPCGPFVGHQDERDSHAFPQIYLTDPEECRSSPPWRCPPRYGTNQGPDSGHPTENIAKQLNTSLHHAGFSLDQTQVMSMGSNPTSSSAYIQCAQFTDSRRCNPLSQEHLENERASEEFLRRLAAKEKYPVPDRTTDRADPHFRSLCPGKEGGQELCADNPVYKRPSPSRGKSRGRSKSRPRSRSHSRGKSRGRSKSRPRSRSLTRGKSRRRSKSRPRSSSRSQGKSRGWSKSRPRSRSHTRGKGQGQIISQPRSRSRSRGKSRGRSKSRPRSRSHTRGKSQGQIKSQPRSRSHTRGKSRGQSNSRPRSRSQTRGKSQGQIKSQPCSRSHTRGKSRGRSNSRPRSRSQTRGKSQSKSCNRRGGQGPSRSCSSESGGTSRRGPPSKRAAMDLFQELVLAGQCKEKEDALTKFKMAAMKKQLDTENHRQGSTQRSDSPVEVSGECQSSSLSRETERFLNAMTKGMESGLFSSILGEMREDQRVQTLRQGLNVSQYEEILDRVKQEAEAEAVGEFLLPHERVRQDSSGFSRILGTMGNPLILQKKDNIFTDIEDEEKFLYGDEDDEDDKNEALIGTVAEPGGDAGITDRSVVGSSRKQNRQSQPLTATSETDGEPGASQKHPQLGSCRPGKARERQDFVDFERIKKALQTIGLDLGLEEVIKMARMQERRADRTSESPQHKRASSLLSHSRSNSRSPSHSHTRKQNSSPNPEKYSASSPPTKQALCSGAPAGFVWSELDQDAQGKQVPFLDTDISQRPVTENMQPSSIVSEAAILERTQLQTANYWPQNPNLQSPQAPALEHQGPSVTDVAYKRVHDKVAIGQFQGLGPLKQALESMKATTKASKMDTLVDFSKQRAQVRTGHLQITPEENAKASEDGEALKAEIQVQLKRNAYLMKELEMFLKQQGTEFLVPVMGFYCRLCEEFFGDITSAQDHATCHSQKEKRKKHADGHYKGRTNLIFQARPAVDIDKQGQRLFDHKPRSKEEPQGYRNDPGPVSVKEGKLETSRPLKVVSGPSSAKAVTSKMREREEEEAKRSDHKEDTSSKASKKKKNKKEKKEKKQKMKKEKKRKD